MFFWGVMSSKCGVPAPWAVHLPRFAIVGLKLVLSEIRSTAHFVFNSGSAGFSPVTLDSHLLPLSQFNHLLSEWTSVYLRKAVRENSLVLRLFKSL